MEPTSNEKIVVPESVVLNVPSEASQMILMKMLYEVANFVDKHNIIVPEVKVKVGPAEVVFSVRRIDQHQSAKNSVTVTPEQAQGVLDSIKSLPIISRFFKKN